MPTTRQPYTFGHYTVRSGNENTFLSAWENMAHETLKHYKLMGNVRLVQDPDNPQNYISFAEWDSINDIKTWMEQPYYRDFAQRAQELCDSYERHHYHVVIDIPATQAVKEQVKTRGR